MPWRRARAGGLSLRPYRGPDEASAPGRCLRPKSKLWNKSTGTSSGRYSRPCVVTASNRIMVSPGSSHIFTVEDSTPTAMYTGYRVVRASGLSGMLELQ